MVITLFKWLSIVAFSLAHPFHVSVTEMNHNAKEQTIEISCKFFVDDFEKGLLQFGKTKVDIQSDAIHEKMNQLISAYIKKNFKLNIDGKDMDQQYLGFEVDKESVFCYFQIDKINSIKKLEIFSTILYNEFDDQSNIFHVNVNEIRKSTKLDFPKTNTIFNF
ncbi:MAG: hypothetical protein EPO57_01545 [Chitinophagaceae bacterium]|nr:MAG: hypothetical protein EPO57_01545 [Chitinophagaceae bacterium]